VLELIGKCLDFFRENARNLERTARLMRRTKIDDFWKSIGVRGKSRY
jgi:NAD(P)H-nitrite reductase large subunit